MVTVHFKLNELGTVKYSLQKPLTLGQLLELCSTKRQDQLGSFIAVRNGKVIQANDRVEDQDIIEIYPALSGG